jgi:hypothetical protein
MSLDKTKLITIANYAKKIGKTPTWIYKLEKANKIQTTKIDGVKFVILD